MHPSRRSSGCRGPEAEAEPPLPCRMTVHPAARDRRSKSVWLLTRSLSGADKTPSHRRASSRLCSITARHLSRPLLSSSPHFAPGAPQHFVSKLCGVCTVRQPLEPAHLRSKLGFPQACPWPGQQVLQPLGPGCHLSAPRFALITLVTLVALVTP